MVKYGRTVFCTLLSFDVDIVALVLIEDVVCFEREFGTVLQEFPFYAGMDNAARTVEHGAEITARAVQVRTEF